MGYYFLPKNLNLSETKRRAMQVTWGGGETFCTFPHRPCGPSAVTGTYRRLASRYKILSLCMASTELQENRRPVVSIAVDCTGACAPCTTFDLPLNETSQRAEPDLFRVVRKSLSQLCVVSQENTDTLCVSMGRMGNPFGLEWRVSSSNDAQSAEIIVKKAFMSGLVTFENQDGTLLASLTHTLCSTSSKLHWKGSTYKWRTTNTAVPLTLELSNAATKIPIAYLKGAAANPWSKDRYTLSIASGQYGPTWLQVVAASAIAEAQRVSGKFSSSGAGASLVTM